jgi:hypothetical protein
VLHWAGAVLGAKLCRLGPCYLGRQVLYTVKGLDDAALTSGLVLTWTTSGMH